MARILDTADSPTGVERQCQQAGRRRRVFVGDPCTQYPSIRRWPILRPNLDLISTREDHVLAGASVAP